jgi:hypothetical protein
MPVVIGVGRPFFSFAASGTAVGNFIRNIQFPPNDHRPTDIDFNTSDDITISVEGITSSGNNYARLLKRDEQNTTTEYQIFNTSNAVEDFSILSIGIDSSNNIHGTGYYELGGNIYPVYVKFDTSGNIVYSKYDSNATGRIGTSISVNGTDIVIAGGDWDNTTLTVEPTYFAKIDSFGQIIWQRDISDVGGTYINFVYNSIKTQSDGSVILVGDFDGSKRKGLISKFSSSGSLIWHKTLEYHGDYDTYVTSSYVDDNDQIFVCGYTVSTLSLTDTNSFVVKYTKEGNILWQSQSPDTGNAFFRNTDVYADSAVGSVYTCGTFIGSSNNRKLCISKYDRNGLLIFKRTLDSNVSSPSDIHYPKFTATNTDLYVTFSDEQNNSSVLYGRLSVSGNGLGDFEYQDGSGNTLVYSLISIPSNTFGRDTLGKLYEGTSYNLSSDFVTYPFNATGLQFDDLATIYNAKSAVYEDNGQEIITTNRTPFAGATAKISSDAIVYDSNLILNYDFGNLGTYDATASTTSVQNLSSTSHTGTINGATFDSAGYFDFDGVNDNINVGTNALTTGATTIEMWVRPSVSQSTGLADLNVGGSGLILYQIGTIIMMGFRGNPEMRTSGGIAFVVNQWQHITWVYNNGAKNSTASFAIYKNAVAETTLTTSGGIGGSTATNRIGSDQTSAYSDSDIGEVRIYNRALTATEVSQNFNATRSKYGV